MARVGSFALMILALLAACSPALTPVVSDTPTQIPTSESAATESPPFEGDVMVWSLGGNGWAVRIDEKMLIFDYVQGPYPYPPISSEVSDLDRGYIDWEELEGLDVYVFVTHEHLDHYDRVIYTWQNRIEQITYIYGWQADDDPDYQYLIGPRAQAQIGSLEVFTINSHHSNVPEVAYLIKVDGITIYHNGDYKSSYEQDFAFLHTITDHIDIAFVIGWPYPDDQYFQQAVLMAELFDPTYMFAICREGDEASAQQFAEMLPPLGVESTILYAEYRGSSFILFGEPAE